MPNAWRICALRQTQHMGGRERRAEMAQQRRVDPAALDQAHVGGHAEATVHLDADHDRFEQGRDRLCRRDTRLQRAQPVSRLRRRATRRYRGYRPVRARARNSRSPSLPSRARPRCPASDRGRFLAAILEQHIQPCGQSDRGASGDQVADEVEQFVARGALHRRIESMPAQLARPRRERSRDRIFDGGRMLRSQLFDLGPCRAGMKMPRQSAGHHGWSV
jgi:hypothetical protein